MCRGRADQACASSRPAGPTHRRCQRATMTKPKILVQLDTDDQASVFDSVVAIDAGAEHLLRHQAITPENVRERVHGAIFTRGPDDLKHTALFVGGSDVARGEQVLAAIVASFIGPLRTSVMMDSGGANTTAAAAVLAAARHLDLASAQRSCWRPRGRSANAWPGCSRTRGQACGLPRDGWTAPKTSPPAFARKLPPGGSAPAASARRRNWMRPSRA